MYICTYSYFALYYTNTKNKAIKRASGASASPDVINAFHSSQIQPLIDWPPAGAVPPDCGQYGCKSFKQGRNLSQMFLQPQSVPVRGVEGGGGYGALSSTLITTQFGVVVLVPNLRFPPWGGILASNIFPGIFPGNVHLCNGNFKIDIFSIYPPKTVVCL